jgi:hypothetical protein
MKANELEQIVSNYITDKRKKGRRRTRTPVAAKTAFTTAAGKDIAPSSPTPLGLSRLGTM